MTTKTQKTYFGNRKRSIYTMSYYRNSGVNGNVALKTKITNKRCTNF